jgi:parallel beta-helix repeat protein
VLTNFTYTAPGAEEGGGQDEFAGSFAGLAGYDYYKGHNIAASLDGNQTGYPMMFIVNNTSGTDSGNTVYLGGHSKKWPYDIRFTDADGNLYPCWLESNTSTAAKWWVNLTSIPGAGSLDMYVNYGNASATDPSNGATTFSFYDHFSSGGSLSAPWTGYGINYGNSVSNSIATITSTSSGAYYTGNTVFGPYNVGIRSRFKSTSNGSAQVGFGNGSTGNTSGIQFYHGGGEQIYGKTTLNYQGSDTGMWLGDKTNYHVYAVERISDTLDRFYADDVSKGTVTSNIYTAPLGATMYVGDSATTLSVDWLVAYKTTLNPPAHAAWGDENMYNNTSSTHPFVFFHNITEVPGHGSSYETQIIANADTVLTYDFAGSTEADFADNSIAAAYLGIAYQATKDSKYIAKGKEAMTNIKYPANIWSTDGVHYIWGWTSMYYAIAYDCLQPTLSPAEDAAARDGVAGVANSTYYAILMRDPGWDDFEGRMIQGIAAAGMALQGYQSTYDTDVTDWVNCGAHDLFIHDEMRDIDPIAGRVFDTNGAMMIAGYKEYSLPMMTMYAQAYNHYYGRNIVQDYPQMRGYFFNSEFLFSMPNGYDSNYGVLGANYKQYLPCWYGLLNTTDRNNLKYLADLNANNAETLLPYTDIDSFGVDGTEQLFAWYLVSNSTTGATSTAPAWTSTLNNTTFYQVFRTGWSQQASWMSQVVYNSHTNDTYSNRDQQHSDQMSVEIYNLGDKVIADSGEPKYTWGYGATGIDHNSLLIENGAVNDHGTNAKAVLKGIVPSGIISPASLDVIQTGWVDATNSSVSISQLEDDTALGSTAKHTRVVIMDRLWNSTEIVFDRAYDATPQYFRTSWHPSTFTLTPTDKSSFATYGHINLYMKINGANYNWLSLANDTDTNTGTTTGKIEWGATNPYGAVVNTTLYTAPSSSVYANRIVQRIQGTGVSGDGEVYAPAITFRSPSTSNLYSVAVVHSRSGTTDFTYTTPTVTGNGNAIKFVNGTGAAYAFTGPGGANSTFETITTDASMLYMRSNATERDYTMFNGTRLHNGDDLINSTGTLSYLSMQQYTSSTLVVNSSSAYTVRIRSSPATSVTMDGAAYAPANYSTVDDNVQLTLTAGEHTYVINTESAAPQASYTANQTSISAGQTVQFTDTSTNVPTSWNWTFGDGAYSLEQNPQHVYSAPGTYNVVLNASNSNGYTLATGSITATPATTLYVPSQYNTVSAAMVAAANGYTIIVDSGTYHEEVNVNKQVTIRGRDTGAGKPTINATTIQKNVFTIQSSGVVLENLTIEGGLDGVSISGFNNLVIRNCTIIRAIDEGVEASNSNYGIIANCNISYNALGSIEGDTNNSITLYYANDWLVENNTMYNNGGVIGVDAAGNHYANGVNTVVWAHRYHLADGVLVYTSNNVTVRNNTMWDLRYGLWVYAGSNNTTFTRNTILSSSNESGLYYDVVVHGSAYANISDNRLMNAARNIWIRNNAAVPSHHVTVANNTMNGSIYGVVVESSYGNTLTNNTWWDCEMNDLFLSNASQNTFTYNNMTQAVGGIIIDSASTGNTFYLNNFGASTGGSANGIESNAGTNTKWNSTAEYVYTYGGTQYTSRLGNKWGTITGTDANNNGVADSAYNTGAGSDYYPLMSLPSGNYTSSGATVTYQATTISFSETAGTVNIPVVKTGADACSVTYTTNPGTATQTTNYQYKTGTLTFPAGDATQNITITLYNDGVATPPKYFFVNLTSPSGCTLGTSTITVYEVDANTHILYVPSQYTTIQAAVNAASAGYTIMVDPGIYNENVVVDKQLTITGSNAGMWNDATTVNATSPALNVFTLTASGIVIQNMTIIGGLDGIHIDGYDNLTVQNCHITRATDDGIEILNSEAGANGGLIQNNNVSGNSQAITTEGQRNTAINLNTTTGYTVNNNTIKDNGGVYQVADKSHQYHTGTAVLIEASSGSTVTNNTMSDDYLGIAAISGSTSTTIRYNHVIDSSNESGLSYDIFIDASSVNTISDNYLGNAARNIYMRNSVTSSTVQNNTMWGSIYGIVLETNVYGNTFANNTWWDCEQNDLVLTNADTNTFTLNNMTGTSGPSVDSASTGNTFYLNNFGTSTGMSLQGTNTWNTTSQIAYVYNGNWYTNYLGNKWIAYAGSDANGDGIGDTSYTTGTATDYRPLIGSLASYTNIGGTAPLLPTVDFYGSPLNGTAPLVVQFTDQSTNATSWAWDFNNDGTNESTARSPSYTYTQAGVYTVVHYANNPNGTVFAIKELYINVTVGPTLPVAGFTATPTSGNVPLTVQFNDTSLYATSWAWDFNNDGASESSTRNATYTYTVPGVYTVVLHATNSNGTDDEIKTNYIAVGSPTMPTAAFTANIRSGVAPLTVQFTDQSLNAVSWQWDFNNDGVNDTSTRHPSHTYTNAGTYTVRLYATNANGTDEEIKASYIVVTNPTPTPTPAPTPVPNAPLCNFGASQTHGTSPLTVYFYDYSSNTPTSWLWEFGDGQTSTAKNPTHVYSAALSNGTGQIDSHLGYISGDSAEYTVKLTVSNAYGSDSLTKNNYVMLVTEGTVPDAPAGYMPHALNITYLTSLVGLVLQPNTNDTVGNITNTTGVFVDMYGDYMGGQSTFWMMVYGLPFLLLLWRSRSPIIPSLALIIMAPIVWPYVAGNWRLGIIVCVTLAVVGVIYSFFLSIKRP